MSYQEQKQAWQRALVASVHGLPEPAVGLGLSEGSFNGGAMTDYMPRPEPRPLPPGDEPRELGWGPSVELEDAC